MTVQAVGFSGPSFIQTPGNGVATVYSFPFLVTAATDLAVGFIVNGVYAPASGFSVNAIYPGNGQVLFTIAPPVGTLVDIRSIIPESQGTNFSNLGGYFPESTTNALDRAVRNIADLYRLSYQFGIHGPDTEGTLWPALPPPSQRRGMELLFDSVSGLPTVGVPTAVPVTSALIYSLITQAGIGAVLLPITLAENAALITPIAQQYLEGDFRRYGADPTGATFSDAAINSAIAVAHKMTQPTLIVNGQFKVVSMNLSNKFGGVNAPDFNSLGLRMIGVGIQSSTITCIASVANTGIGIDASGLAYWHWSNIRFNFGTSGADSPQVGLLLGKTSAGGSVFSGIGKFECCQFIGRGNASTFNVFNQGAEDIDWNNCINIAVGLGRPLCFSRANTPGIVSPNTTLESPADSMTTQTFSGGETIIQANGDCCVFLDIGATTGVGGFDFGSAFIDLTGATTMLLKDNGGVGSTITGVHASNIDIEFNGGAGTNQVMVLGSQYCNDFHFKGSSAYTNPATQISTLFTFGNPLLNSHISWTGNANPGGSQPSSLISCSQASGCIFQTTGVAGSVTVSAGGQFIVMGSDYVQSNMGATMLTQPLTANPGSGDGTMYTLATLKGGVRTSVLTDGGIRRITKANISSTTAIYTGLTYGELMTVTGTAAGGTTFADLLMCSYGTVTVISSNSQAGSPAARTYTVTTGTLSLAMASGTYNIIAQSIITGSQQ